jgi:hypothetical protein
MEKNILNKNSFFARLSPFAKFFLITICIFLLIFSIIFPFLGKNKIEETRNAKIIGKVYDFYEYKGSLWVKITNSDTEFVFECSKNYRNKPISLNEFLNKTDSIYKPKNSDSLVIYRNNFVYYYILGKDISKLADSTENIK